MKQGNGRGHAGGGLAAQQAPPIADGAGSDAEIARTQHEVVQRIEHDSRFVVATHENPDGDALGSLVAAHALLKSLGKNVETFVAESDFPLPDEYRSLELEDLIHEVPEDIATRTVMFLDCGNIDRSPASALSTGAHVVNIDHHHDNTRFGTLNHVVPNASCTAEVIWEIMNELGITPSGEIADGLYVALVTDTGRFMYENTGARAHEMAAALIKGGVDVQRIYRRLYEEIPESKLTLLALALNHTQRFDSGELTLAELAPRTSSARARSRATRRGSSTNCAPCRARRLPRSYVSSSPPSGAGSARSRCARPTTTSTCRRSRGRRAAAATAARPASRHRSP